MNTSGSPQTSSVESGAELVEVTGVGLRIVEIAIVTLIGVLVSPPLLILAVVVAVPTLAVVAVIAAVVGVVAVPAALVRRVHAHHREHGSTLFLHRVLP